MTDYIADDFSAIAAGLRKLEAERNPQTALEKPRLAKPWTCKNCGTYKSDDQVLKRDGYKPRCGDCSAVVTPR